MKILFLFCFALSASSLFSQNLFNDCAAAFLNKEAIIETYSPKASAEITKNAKGKLEVYTTNITETAIEPKKNIAFKIAIQDKETKTIWLFSEETYLEIPIEKILSACKKGDSILLITIDKSFALSHNKILVK